jgi:hypothetical protein
MSVANAASNPNIAIAAVHSAALQSLVTTPAPAQTQNNAAANAPPPQAIVSVASTTSATGLITWVITYANGATQTMTSSGPMPASTRSILV